MYTFLKKFSRKSSGFTLIELLVVVSIIGMLASIVMASLNSARLKGKDASAISSMSSMRSEAELAFSNGAYPVDLCTVALDPLIDAANAQVPASNSVVCTRANNPSRWSATVTLNDGSNFCVDSTGFSGTGTPLSARCVPGGGGS